HALVAHDHVRLRVAEHVADVQRARGRGRRGVDAEDLVASGLGVEGVEVLLAPYAVPLLLQALEGGAVGDGGITARCGTGHGGHGPRSAPACNAGGDSVSAPAHRSRPETSAARRPLSWTGAWQQQLAHTPPRAAMSPSATRPRRRAPARTAVRRPVPRPVPPCPGPRPAPRTSRARRPAEPPPLTAPGPSTPPCRTSSPPTHGPGRARPRCTSSRPCRSGRGSTRGSRR